MRARPSAEIRVAEVQKLRTFCDFCWPAEIRVVEVQKLRAFYDVCGPRATLCGDRARRSALAVAPCEFSLGEPSAEIVRVAALSLWRHAIFLLAKRPLEVVSWFARLSVLLQLRLENRNF